MNRKGLYRKLGRYGDTLCGGVSSRFFHILLFEKIFDLETPIYRQWQCGCAAWKFYYGT
jgi:hypothetical protein